MAHLANVNTARLRAPVDDPLVAGFVARLDEVNRAADAAPGFVWRLQTEDGDATAVRVSADPRDIVNLSVWRSLAELREFVYRGTHVEAFRRRAEWFDPEHSHLALWWVTDGELPSVGAAMDRVRFIEEHGPSPYAFRFAPAQPVLVFERAEPGSRDASALVAELDAALEAAAEDPADNFLSLSAEEVTGDAGCFVVGRLDGEPVACGAFRRLEDGTTAELKRMYVRPAARGAKVGHALLAELTTRAREAGARRLVLETSDRLAPAMRLYERAGFRRCPCWGEYALAPRSTCLSRDLTG